MTVDGAKGGDPAAGGGEGGGGDKGAATDLLSGGQPDPGGKGAGALSAGGDKAGHGGEKAYWETVPEPYRELVKAKGWKGDGDFFASYQSLERTYGADKAGRALVLPKEDAPAEAWGEVWAKLGRPDTPDGYKLTEGLPEGAALDPEFAGWAGGVFHEAGLSARQAAVIRDKWQEFQAASVAAEDRQFMEAGQADVQALRTEWGSGFDDKIALGARFAQAAGFSQGELAAVERVLGTRALLERMAEMGKRLGEDPGLPGGAEGGGELAGAEGARAEIDKLKADKAFMRKVNSRDREALERWDALHRTAYPEKAA